MFRDKPFEIVSEGFTGHITELRLRKEKYSVKEIKDVYKTPLGVVSEKRSKLKFQFVDKKDI